MNNIPIREIFHFHHLPKLYFGFKRSVICMGLLISRPSVFVWGPEACLSAVFIVFVKKRALYERKLYLW